MFEGIIMEIKTFYCNPLRECSYVAWDETKECVIIDVDKLNFEESPEDFSTICDRIEAQLHGLF